jgi:hypothetical protein
MPQLPGAQAPTVVSLTEVLTWCEPGLMTTICGVPELPWTDCPSADHHRADSAVDRAAQLGLVVGLLAFDELRPGSVDGGLAPRYVARQGPPITGRPPAAQCEPPPQRELCGTALEFACWVSQLRQIGVIVSPRGPKLEQLPRQGQLRCCLPLGSHLKPPLAKPPSYEYANYHHHGRHHGGDRSRRHLSLL